MSRTQAVLLAFAAAIFVLGFATLAEDLFDDARVQQAFVAGSFLAAGWMTAFAFRQLNELLERNQRSKDVQEAFRAEIFDYSEAMDDDGPEDTARRISERVRIGGHGAGRYHPLVPRVSPPVVFAALALDIHLLPQATIDSVVQFYSVLSDVTVFAEDLMSDAFVAAEAESRANALRDYMEMRGTLLKLPKDAIEDLDASLAEDGFWHPLAVSLGICRVGAADV